MSAERHLVECYSPNIHTDDYDPTDYLAILVVVICQIYPPTHTHTHTHTLTHTNIQISVHCATVSGFHLA